MHYLTEVTFTMNYSQKINTTEVNRVRKFISSYHRKWGVGEEWLPNSFAVGRLLLFGHYCLFFFFACLSYFFFCCFLVCFCFNFWEEGEGGIEVGISRETGRGEPRLLGGWRWGEVRFWEGLRDVKNVIKIYCLKNVNKNRV